MRTAPQGPPTSHGGPPSAFAQTCAASLSLSEQLCKDAALASFYRQTRALLGGPLDRSALAVVQRSLISSLSLAEAGWGVDPTLSPDAIEDALADVRRLLKIPMVLIA